MHGHDGIGWQNEIVAHTGWWCEKGTPLPRQFRHLAHSCQQQVWSEINFVTEHKSKFVQSELEQVKLTQSHDDGLMKMKKSPFCSGEHGVEALLHAEEHFMQLLDNCPSLLMPILQRTWKKPVLLLTEAWLQPCMPCNASLS